METAGTVLITDNFALEFLLVHYCFVRYSVTFDILVLKLQQQSSKV